MLEEGAGDVSVVEGVGCAVDDLAGFVAFASEKDNIVFGGHVYGCGDGVFAGGDDVVREVYRQASGDLIADFSWVFAAGIVVRDDDVAAMFGCSFGHEGAFGIIAVAACAEEGDEFSVFGEEGFKGGGGAF